MANVLNSIYSLRSMDDLAGQDTLIHRIHPLAKLMTTFGYLVAVVSFNRYEISGLIPFVLYPILLFSLAEVPPGMILKRLLLVEPLIIGIGILNPVFDQQAFVLGGVVLSRGWVTFLAIIIKSGLTVLAALLLIATTGMDKLAAAMRLLRIPRLFVLQLLLTYRYIAVLMEEVSRILTAYSLRAPKQKGVHWRVWGSLAGQLLLRTFERAQRVYQAMCLRGFAGEYYTGVQTGFRFADMVYVMGWGLFFLAARLVDIPALLGMLATGVSK